MTSTRLRERLDFVQIGDAARSAMQKSRAVIDRGVAEGLEQLYARIRATSEISRFFSGESQINAAKDGQKRHWGRVAAGDFSDDYWESVRRIGETHARIGLKPQWHIGGYALILDKLIRVVVAEKTKAKGVFGRVDSDDLAETLASLVKAAMIDMDLAISVYLEASERAQAELDAQAKAAAAEQQAAMTALTQALSALSEGNLTHRIEERFPAAYEQQRVLFNATMERLQDAMRGIAANVGGVRTGAGEIGQAADDLSRRTEQQAASLEETAAALDEVTATVRKTAEGANLTNNVVASTRADAEASGKVVADTVAAMSEIERSAKQISQIIGVIDEIAFQTNLLALNAGVEAARAGEAGRGFAVVASEVRALAQRSSDAAKEIKALISASSQHVETGVGLVGEAGKALRLIADRVGEISGLVGEIAASAQEQATALSQVNTAINQMDQVTQQNAAMVEQSTAASHSLTQEANDLMALIARFKTGEPIVMPAPASRPVRPQPIAVQQKRIATFASRQAAAPATRTDEDWEEF
ncbi:MAG TPA: globin-coupled sensor protein [Vitreimonas sp.]|uniref:globin-coupled sensor protein n=1 Tax=Vitreimonas sp. TaxID=3069702 RepID=UPI002D3DE8CC|nr:globin-coupled sensor protein [Vitreimonas sp.]HYD88803.1 globin-coupled sensor protein [Vitreimonas sp.]